jgi:hypothetical protein
LRKLFLINDDQPAQFAPREVTIVRNDIRVEGQPGLAVTIEPALENAAGGPLRAAILVPRHKGILLESSLADSNPSPVSVFVNRFHGDVRDLPRDMTKDRLP